MDYFLRNQNNVIIVSLCSKRVIESVDSSKAFDEWRGKDARELFIILVGIVISVECGNKNSVGFSHQMDGRGIVGIL